MNEAPKLATTPQVLALVKDDGKTICFINSFHDLSYCVHAGNAFILAAHKHNTPGWTYNIAKLAALSEIRGHLQAAVIRRTTIGSGATYVVNCICLKRLYGLLSDAGKISGHQGFLSGCIDVLDSISGYAVLSLEERTAFDPAVYLEVMGHATCGVSSSKDELCRSLLDLIDLHTK